MSVELFNKLLCNKSLLTNRMFNIKNNKVEYLLEAFVKTHKFVTYFACILTKEQINFTSESYNIFQTSGWSFFKTRFSVQSKKINRKLS